MRVQHGGRCALDNHVYVGTSRDYLTTVYIGSGFVLSALLNLLILCDCVSGVVWGRAGGTGTTVRA